MAKVRRRRAKTHPFSDAVVKPLDIHKDRHVIVIDMGTESTRVDAFNQDIHRCYHQTFSNKNLIVKKSGKKHLDDSVFAKLCDFVHEHLQAIRQHYPKDTQIPICMVGTEIIRKLPNEEQEKLKKKLKAETGVDLQIISGAEEIQLYAEAIRIFWPNAKGCVIHIGHGSLDVTGMDADGKASRSLTFPHGMHHPATDAEIETIMPEIKQKDQKAIFLCGKALRQMARYAFGIAADSSMMGSTGSFHFTPKEFSRHYEMLVKQHHCKKEDFSYPAKIIYRMLQLNPKLTNLYVISRGMREALAVRLFEKHMAFRPNPSSVFVPDFKPSTADAQGNLTIH